MNIKKYLQDRYYLDIEKMFSENERATLKQDIECVYYINQRYSYLCEIESIDMDFAISEEDIESAYTPVETCVYKWFTNSDIECAYRPVKKYVYQVDIKGVL